MIGGCNLHADLDSVQYSGVGPAADASDAGRDALGDDVDPDSQEPREDIREEGDAGQDVDVELGDECALVGNSGCTDPNRACVYDEASERTRCVGADEIGAGNEGDDCTTFADCADGLVCVDWALPDPRGSVCSRPCEIGASTLCSSGQFCASSDLDIAEGLGFCTEGCDLTDSGESCQSWERCVPDPFQSEVAFSANSRCLLNDDGGTDEGGAPIKRMNASCSAAQLHEDGCPAGLTCLPVTTNGTTREYCLEPCQVGATDIDCTFFNNLNTCEPIEDSGGFGYCKN